MGLDTNLSLLNSLCSANPSKRPGAGFQETSPGCGGPAGEKKSGFIDGNLLQLTGNFKGSLKARVI